MERAISLRKAEVLPLDERNGAMCWKAVLEAAILARCNPVKARCRHNTKHRLSDNLSSSELRSYLTDLRFVPLKERAANLVARDRKGNEFSDQQVAVRTDGTADIQVH